jgi:acyl-CoA reductase-like NAD-dependent aldehyde dehydrogenase
MSAHELKELLDQVPDTRELVLRRAAGFGPTWNAHYDAWSDAHEEAEHAFCEWKLLGGRQRYSLYRAAQDREDAAQDALAAAPVA